MIRFSTDADTQAVTSAMYRMWALNEGNNQMKYTDEVKALDYIASACAAGRVAIVDDEFAIMFDVGTQWYSSSRFLIEECMLRIKRGQLSVNVAIDALDELKAQFDCVLTVVGDTQVGIMTPRYLAKGYRLLGTQLIKD